jgi:hypothetical protein
MDVFGDMFENMRYAKKQIEILEAENEELMDEYDMYAHMNAFRGCDFSQELAEIHDKIITNDFELAYLYDLAEYGYDVA